MALAKAANANLGTDSLDNSASTLESQRQQSRSKRRSRAQRTRKPPGNDQLKDDGFAIEMDSSDVGGPAAVSTDGRKRRRRKRRQTSGIDGQPDAGFSDVTKPKGRGRRRESRQSGTEIVQTVRFESVPNQPAAGGGGAGVGGGAGSVRNDGEAADQSAGHGHSRHKGRRKYRGGQRHGQRHRIWKPWTQQTAEERKETEANEAKRVERRLAMSLRSGRPPSPPNTTQFIMEQAYANAGVKTPIITPRYEEDDETSVESSSHNRSLPHPADTSIDMIIGDDKETMDSEFDEWYQQAQQQRVDEMDRDELISELFDLRRQVDQLSAENRRLEQRNVRLENNHSAVVGEMEALKRRLDGDSAQKESNGHCSNPSSPNTSGAAVVAARALGTDLAPSLSCPSSPLLPTVASSPLMTAGGSATQQLARRGSRARLSALRSADGAKSMVPAKTTDSAR